MNEITKAGGFAAFIQTDQAKEEDIKRLVDHTVEKFGRLDAAFNNAGAVGFAPVAEQDRGFLDQSFELNHKGVVYLLKYEIAAMRKNAPDARGLRGAIVNTSTSVTFSAMPGASAYAAAKEAMVLTSKIAAKEEAPNGIRINVVSPGYTSTPMLDGLGGEEAIPGVKQVPLGGKAGKSEDIAHAVLFLLNQTTSAYTTGANLLIDGGSTL